MYKKLFSENLIKRTCCCCGNYWPHSGACPKCKEWIEHMELTQHQKEKIKIDKDIQEYLDNGGTVTVVPQENKKELFDKVRKNLKNNPHTQTQNEKLWKKNRNDYNS